MGQCNSSRYRQ